MSGLDLDALQGFVRVAELRSFTRAARQAGVPRARVSAQVQRLEAALGARLLQRTTRVVRTTPEGDELLGRARALLAEVDALTAMFRPDRAVQGRVSLELPVVVARDAVIPRVPELVRRHPELQLDIRTNDRVTAALREGLDVVLRIGPVSEPGLVGRRLGVVGMANWASPAYLRERGTPTTLASLQGHVVVHYAGDGAPNFEYHDGEAYRELPMRSLVTVDSFEAYEAAGVAGLGIVQLPLPPRDGGVPGLVRILPELVARPAPVSLLHTHGRAVPPRVRAVLTWLTELLGPLLAEHRTP